MKLYDEASNEYFERNMFGKCEEALTQVSEARVFDICSNDNGESFFIGEMCDEWYSQTLTKEMCENLSELFMKLSIHLSKAKDLQ